MNALPLANTLHARATARAIPLVLLCAMLTACGGGSSSTSGDDSGNNGATNPGNTTTDTEKPRVTAVQIGSPAAGRVQLSATARDNVGVTGYCYRPDTTVPVSSDPCFQTSAAITVDVPAGHLTWRVYARDAAGQVSTAFEQLLDLVAPTVSAVTPVSLASGKISVKVTAADAHGVSAVCLRPPTDTSVPTATDICFTAGDTVSIDATIGPADHRAHARDASGNVSAAFAARFDAYALFDTGDPTITGITVSKVGSEVDMTASALDNHGISGYCFKPDSSAPTDACFKPEATQRFPAPTAFQPYKVYAKDHAGRISTAFDHVLDVVAPVVQAVVRTEVTDTQVKLRIDAQDAHGVSGYCLQAASAPAPQATDSCFTSQTTVSANRPIDFSIHRAYARDAAGNVSAAVSHTVDMVSPSVQSVTLGLPVSGQVPVTATAVDSVGVTGLCLRSDNIEPAASDACFVSTTAAYSATHTFSLTAPTAATTLKIYARDADGRVSLGSPISLGYCAAASVGTLPKVCVVTTHGEFVMELDNVRAPISSNNVLRYVDDGFYTDTQFHRVMSNFMVQGGGFNASGVAKTATYAAIALEKTTTTGLSHTVGTVAMARTTATTSATSQFFVNVVDNTSKLDSTSTNDGYAVFGKVIAGMDTTIQLIRWVPVQTSSGELSKPYDAPRILRATRVR